MIDYKKVQKIQDLANRIPINMLQDLLDYVGKEYSYNYSGYAIKTDKADVGREDLIEYLSTQYTYSDSSITHAVDVFLKIMDLFDSATMMYDKYLQLNDEPVLNYIESNVDEDTYYDVAFDYIREFERESGSELYTFGRNGRHICVRFNAKNLQEYYDLYTLQRELQEKMIEDLNGFYSYYGEAESRKVTGKTEGYGYYFEDYFNADAYDKAYAKLKVLRDKLDNGEISFEDVYNKFVRTGNYSDMSTVIGWGFTRDDLQFLVNKYKRGSSNTKHFIEELLTDCNFHSECNALINGNYDEVVG